MQQRKAVRVMSNFRPHGVSMKKSFDRSEPWVGVAACLTCTIYLIKILVLVITKQYLWGNSPGDEISKRVSHFYLVEAPVSC